MDRMPIGMQVPRADAVKNETLTTGTWTQKVGNRVQVVQRGVPFVLKVDLS